MPFFRRVERLRRLAAGFVPVLALAWALGACGGGTTTTQEAADATADVAVLMIGNSHTEGAGLPQRLQTLLQMALPGRQVLVMVAPSSAFLDEHLNDDSTLALLTARRWQAVVLQAQKYSSSGQVEYPTVAAEEFVRRARAQGAVPVLYPEWARRGVDEAGRIWALHQGIAGRVAACVAPIPQAWKAALTADPTLPLHAADGNHASDVGAQLTAWVLMATITELSPATFGDVPGGGNAGRQRQLRTAASVALAAQGGRALCPGEPAVR
jgi:hypothetical protein